MNPCYRPVVRNCLPTNENIYNLLPAIVQTPGKEKLYKSIYNRKVVLESDCGKSGTKTFGRSDLHLRGPKNFLKKEEGRPRIVLEQRVKKQMNHSCDSVKKALKPKHDVTPICDGIEKPKMFKRTTVVKNDYSFNPNKNYCSARKETLHKFNEYLDKLEEKKERNFIKTNTKKIASFQKKVDRQKSLVVFTRKGDKYLYDKCGFDNAYSNSQRMGKTPTYLKNRKIEVEKNVNEFNEKLKKKIESEAMKKLTDVERQELLDCLEASREKLQMRFEALPLVNSSFKTRTARIKLNELLAQIEKDIRLISAHSQIYVAQ